MIERKDRIKDQTQTVGTGDFTLDLVTTAGFRTFATHTDGASIRYLAATQDLRDWEVGEGVWTAATRNLTRATIFASSNGDAPVNFTAGVKAVASVMTAADLALTKADVALGNVSNDAQLKIASNLADLADVLTARQNLGLDLVNNTADVDKPISTATQTALNAKLDKTANLADLDSIATAKANLALDQVDNTADLAKPISTATQTALDGKAPLAHTHGASDLSGVIKTLNGTPPDASGNLELDVDAGSKLAKSENLADLTNVATARINLGLGVAALVDTALALRNKIINGNFDFWQRGTSLAAETAVRFLADRWLSVATVNTTIAPSRQAFTVGQTDVPGEPQYFHRCVVVAGTANAGNAANLTHRIESIRTLAGKIFTVTAWIRAGASQPVSVELTQVFGSGGSAQVQGIGTQKFNLTADTWTKVTVAATVPSISGKTIGPGDFLGLRFWFSAGSNFNSQTDTLGEQSGTFDIAQVQFEEGSIATPFEQRPRALELALCQRYYEKSFPIETAPAQNAGDADASVLVQIGGASASQNLTAIVFKVRKRTSSVAVTTFNPSAANSQIRNFGTGTDWSSTTVAVSGSREFQLSGTSPAGSSAGQRSIVHWSADAEL